MGTIRCTECTKCYYFLLLAQILDYPPYSRTYPLLLTSNEIQIGIPVSIDRRPSPWLQRQQNLQQAFIIEVFLINCQLPHFFFAEKYRKINQTFDRSSRNIKHSSDRLKIEDLQLILSWNTSVIVAIRSTSLPLIVYFSRVETSPQNL